MYLAYLGTTIPLLRKRLAGWPGAAGEGKFGLGTMGVITNVLAITYGASMVVNLAWPRVAFYGALWYQKWGVIIGVLVVIGSGMIIYYGYQKDRMGVLDEHRAESLVGD